MSHEFKQGFSVREQPWHGLGVVLDEYPGREEAMRLAGHDFRVVEEELAIKAGSDWHGLDTWKAVVREDTRELLHVFRSTYKIVQPDVMWDIADALVEQPKMHYETAGVLKDGAIMWVLAWLDEPTTITGDISPTYPFVCVSTTHDGSGALTARATAIRVVCWNTLSAADSQGQRSGREFKFRHTSNVMDKIEQAKAAIKGTREDFAEYVELAEELSGLRATDDGIENFLAEFVPMPEIAIYSDKVKGNIEEARGTIRGLLNSETSASGQRGWTSAYDLVQAGTEYLDHLRGYRSEGTYFGRSVLRREPAKLKLTNLARRAATR